MQQRVVLERLTGGAVHVKRAGMTVSLSGESYEAFVVMIEVLLNDRQIADVCDSATIHEEALSCADEAARLAAEGRLSRAQANELATGLRRRLLGPYEEAEYFVLVPGLSLPGPVTVGTVPLRPLVTQQDVEDLCQRLANQRRADQRRVSPDGLETVERVLGVKLPSRGEGAPIPKAVLTPPPKGVCLATRHLAVSREKGFEMTQEWVQEATDLLTFFGRWRDTALTGAGDALDWVQSLARFGRVTLPRRRPSHSFADVDLQEMNSDGLAWASAALAKGSRDRTPLERGVLLAIRWISEASGDGFASALVKHVAALEALLLGAGDQPFASTLAERLAFLLGKAKEQRVLIERRARRVYKARSEFVHRGDDRRLRSSGEWSWDLAEAATREVIRRAMELGWRSQDDVAAWVADRRYEYPIESGPYPPLRVEFRLEIVGQDEHREEGERESD